MNYMGQNNAPGPNQLMMAANMLNSAFNGSPGMNRAPQNMRMGPVGPNNMDASPQPPSNWRDMMNKNAAHQRMYQNQMGPQMHQGQRMGGGGGPHNMGMPMRGNGPNNRAKPGVKFQKPQQQPQQQQRKGGQGQFKKAQSPGVGKHDLRRQLQLRKSQSPGPGAAQANAKAKAAKANATAKKAAFKKKLSEEGTEADESKTETAPTEAVKKEGSVDGDEKVAAMKVESDEDKDKASPYFGIHSGLLFCPTCNIFSDSPSKFQQHLKSKGHDKVLIFVAEQNVAMEGFLRGQCKLAEARRDARRGTFVQKSHKCNMCQVRTQMAKFHVNSDEHKNLKKFLHPVLDGVQFHDRAELEKHKVSVKHLKALMAKGITDLSKHYTDLMDLQVDSLSERSAAWTKPSKESSKEYFEISRKIKGYTMPDYDELDPQPIGFAFLKTVAGSHCKLCDKQLTTKEELCSHMKTREHYDLFAADVAERREKVAASEVKKAAANEAKKRSASEAALEEDEAVAPIVKSEPVIKTEEEGNFKRPKKDEEEEEEFDDDIDGPGLDGPDLLGDDEAETEDAVATA